MKKFYTLSFILLATLSFGQALLTETFNYTVPGNVGGNTSTASDAVGSNNWATHSNTSSTTGVGLPGTIDVTTGSLSYTGLFASVGNKVMLPGSNTTTSRDINRAITTTSKVVYYSALINVIDNTQLKTTPDYFMALGATSGTSVTTLGARLGISSATGTNYRLSILNTSGGTPVYIENAVDLAFGTTYLVVVKYDFSAALTAATIWVNPSSLGGTEPASSVATNTSGTSTFTVVNSITLRNSANTPKVGIDELRVGTTWADVTPAAALGIKQNEISGLNMYPNPVSNGNLHISSDNNSAKSVEIYDILGKQVLNAKVSNNTVNVSNLKGGAYIVKINEEGKTATRKLIIE
jgi:hypothetical protein